MTHANSVPTPDLEDLRALPECILENTVFVIKMRGPRNLNGNCERSYVFYNDCGLVLAVGDGNSGGPEGAIALAGRGETLPEGLQARLTYLCACAPVFEVKARKLREVSKLANNTYQRELAFITPA